MESLKKCLQAPAYFIRDLGKNTADFRKEHSYQPVITECKGVLNVFLGVSALGLCPFLKCFKPSLYESHLKGGVKALKQGTKELLPFVSFATFIGGVVLAGRRWSHLKDIFTEEMK